MFGTSPHNYWKDPKNFKEYADWLCKKLQIKQPEDWYRVPVHQIVKCGITSNYYPNLQLGLKVELCLGMAVFLLS
jgi:hypothetical protein